MATFDIEALQKRVESLESEVAKLRARVEVKKKDWRELAGSFSGDDVMREIEEAALRSREADREAARNDPTYFDEEEG
jgi:flagellar biosynthesis chaperone FliJ